MDDKPTYTRPSESPAALALAEFRQLQSISQYASLQNLGTKRFFTDDLLGHPAQRRLIRALDKDLRRVYQQSLRGPEQAWSFTPQAVLRGVPPADESITKGAFFQILAAEIAHSPSTSITIQQRWCAVLASVRHDGVLTAMKYAPADDLKEKTDISSFSQAFKSIIQPHSKREEAFLVAMLSRGNTSLVKAYIQDRDDMAILYHQALSIMTEVIEFMPDVEKDPNSVPGLISAISFVQSQVDNTEFLLTNPVFDGLRRLLPDSITQDPSFALPAGSEMKFLQKQFLEKVGPENIKKYARKSDFLFKALDPDNRELSEPFLRELDVVFAFFPEMRPYMPAISSVWSRSRLGEMAKVVQGHNRHTARKPGL